MQQIGQAGISSNLSKLLFATACQQHLFIAIISFDLTAVSFAASNEQKSTYGCCSMQDSNPGFNLQMIQPAALYNQCIQTGQCSTCKCASEYCIADSMM